MIYLARMLTFFRCFLYNLSTLDYLFLSILNSYLLCFLFTFFLHFLHIQFVLDLLFHCSYLLPFLPLVYFLPLIRFRVRVEQRSNLLSHLSVAGAAAGKKEPGVRRPWSG